jgi:hypothetical protein
LVLLPASVAASISVLNRMAVAKSALHSKQHFSVLPGSSNNSWICPQTLHGAIESFSVPFGPVNMKFLDSLPPSYVSRSGAPQIDLLRQRITIDSREGIHESLRQQLMSCNDRFRW